MTLLVGKLYTVIQTLVPDRFPLLAYVGQGEKPLVPICPRDDTQRSIHFLPLEPVVDLAI